MVLTKIILRQSVFPTLYKYMIVFKINKVVTSSSTFLVKGKVLVKSAEILKPDIVQCNALKYVYTAGIPYFLY